MPRNPVREREWWDAKAAREQTDRADEAVNRALRWREIERHLAGVRTVLDVGGGTGAFSVPLARRGLEVTHVDLSPAMLDRARQNAGGLTNIHFLEADAADLSRFGDGSFDLVLNLDGAISFAGEAAERCLGESCRVAGRTLMVSVCHRAALTVAWVRASVAAIGELLPAVWSMLERGWWDQEEFESNDQLTRQVTMQWMPPLRAFLPAELEGLLRRQGLEPLRLGGLGTLAGLLPAETLTAVADRPEQWQRFLDLCERYDREILPHGPGTRERAGLIAVARRP